MTTRNEQLQKIWRRYEGENEHLPSSSREVVTWAVSEGLLDLPAIDPYDMLAGEMSKALREEYGTDLLGRRYRMNHAVRITKSGVQTTFWGTMGFAKHEHMQAAFVQRRNQVIGDCFQLKVDVDVYNSLNTSNEPIQLDLNFTNDVIEKEFWNAGTSKKAA